MPLPVTGNIDRVKVITSVQRRRRWSTEEKARIVQSTRFTELVSHSSFRIASVGRARVMLR
jgi:hypothetical protein